MSAVMPSSEYLSRQELHILTDYARPNKQAAWLANKNIPHLLYFSRIWRSRRRMMRVDNQDTQP